MCCPHCHIHVPGSHVCGECRGDTRETSVGRWQGRGTQIRRLGRRGWEDIAIEPGARGKGTPQADLTRRRLAQGASPSVCVVWWWQRPGWMCMHRSILAVCGCGSTPGGREWSSRVVPHGLDCAWEGDKRYPQAGARASKCSLSWFAVLVVLVTVESVGGREQQPKDSKRKPHYCFWSHSSQLESKEHTHKEREWTPIRKTALVGTQPSAQRL